MPPTAPTQNETMAEADNSLQDYQGVAYMDKVGGVRG